ncbi:MAG: M48 family metalloprotease [Pseudomonadota bacterium]
MTALLSEAATQAWLDRLSPEDVARAVEYTQGSHWIAVLSVGVTVAICWLIVRSGVLAWVQRGVTGNGNRVNRSTFVVSALFFAMLGFGELGWDIYTDWHREKAFGLSNQPFDGWMIDWAVFFAIETLFVSLFATALYALIRRFAAFWWVMTSWLVIAFLAVFLLLSPTLIDPLFNDYELAPEGEVRDAIVRLAEKTGTPSDAIVVFDGSRQSERYTANVSGFLSGARIALSDTMFAKGADQAEIEAVVAHEIAHYQHGDPVWTILFYSALSALAFWIVHRTFAMTQRWMGQPSHVTIADPRGLPVLVTQCVTLALLATPLIATFTRTIEWRADQYSLKVAQQPDGLASALIKTVDYRAPSPSVVEEVLFYSHPSVERRIRQAMEWKYRREQVCKTQEPTRLPGGGLCPLAIEIEWRESRCLGSAPVLS